MLSSLLSSPDLLALILPYLDAANITRLSATANVVCSAVLTVEQKIWEMKCRQDYGSCWSDCLRVLFPCYGWKRSYIEISLLHHRWRRLSSDHISPSLYDVLPSHNITAIDCNHCGTILLCGCGDGTVAVATVADPWLSRVNVAQLQNGFVVMGVMRNDSVVICCLSASSDDCRGATTGKHGTVCVWNTRTRRLLFVVAHQAMQLAGRVTALQLERCFLVTGHLQGSLFIINAHNGHLMHALPEAHSLAVNKLRLGGDVVVSCSNDATVKIWSLQNDTMIDKENDDDRCCTNEPHLIATLSSHTSLVNDVILSSDDATWICSASSDGTIGLWSPSHFPSSNVVKLHSHAGYVLCLSWVSTFRMRNGKLCPMRALLSGGTDGVIRMWNPDTILNNILLNRSLFEGVHVADLVTSSFQNSSIWSLQAAGGWVVAASKEGMVALWSVAACECVSVFEVLGGWNMSPLLHFSSFALYLFVDRAYNDGHSVAIRAMGPELPTLLAQFMDQSCCYDASDFI